MIHRQENVPDDKHRIPISQQRNNTRYYIQIQESSPGTFFQNNAPEAVEEWQNRGGDSTWHTVLELRIPDTIAQSSLFGKLVETSIGKRIFQTEK